MERVDTKPTIRELLRLVSDLYGDGQFETARNFAERALALAEASHDPELEIVSRFDLIGIDLALGYSEEAITHAALLLEYLYSPEALAQMEHQDAVLEIILSAFPLAIAGTIQGNIGELIMRRRPDVIARIAQIIEQGFNTLEQLQKQHFAQSLYYLQGELAFYNRDWETALQNHERAWALWQRVPEGRALDGGSCELALAIDYGELGQAEKQVDIFDRVQRNTSYSLQSRAHAAGCLAITLLDRGRITEAEQQAERALEIIRQIESPFTVVLGQAQLFEVLLEAGKGSRLISDLTSLVLLLRRFRHLPAFAAPKQAIFSQCGEARLQQALDMLGLPTTGEVPQQSTGLGTSQTVQRAIRLSRQALRWFGRVDIFEQRQLVAKANQLLELLSEARDPGNILTVEDIRRAVAEDQGEVPTLDEIKTWIQYMIAQGKVVEREPGVYWSAGL